MFSLKNITKCMGTTLVGLWVMGFATLDILHTGALNSFSIVLIPIGAALVTGRVPPSWSGEDK